jgi:hypothetical protein
MLKDILFKAPFVHKPISYFFNRTWKKIKLKCKHITFLWYFKIIRKLAKPIIEYSENEVFNRFSLSALINAKEYTVSKRFTDRIIISTTTGLWILNDNSIKQITIGACYGISRIGTRWYVSQRLGTYSRILSFRLDLTNEQPKMRDTRIELTGLPINIHQIDSFDKTLYVLDTTNNRVQSINEHNKRRLIYPNNKTPNRANNHFNSIFITDKFLFILAHNGWLKPKKKSQIFVVSRLTLKNVEIIELDAQEAHNIILYNNEWMYCDSLGGVLKWGNNSLFTDRGHFLRGLALTKDTIFVGGSEIIERDKRILSDSILWLLDHLGRVKRYIKLKKIGQICEIRAIDFDYGLSESWEKEH